MALMENLSNNIPDKIYIPRTNMEVENRLEEFWVDHKTFDSDIEYIRKDVFIEKALEYIRKEIRPHYSDVKYKYEDFKKYMND